MISAIKNIPNSNSRINTPQKQLKANYANTGFKGSKTKWNYYGAVLSSVGGAWSGIGCFLAVMQNKLDLAVCSLLLCGGFGILYRSYLNSLINGDRK